MNAKEHALRYWYPIAMSNELTDQQTRHTTLLETEILLKGTSNNELAVSADGNLFRCNLRLIIGG